ncbi:hypothetical protein [Streptomyces albicerus]|uniref:hypothetical protein n=1 Tax=Streptomyces albicerus TaxID=2569859 RepID=UPI00124B4526|nr:hypothetical protein [Streptomyces albicerus]
MSATVRVTPTTSVAAPITRAPKPPKSFKSSKSFKPAALATPSLLTAPADVTVAEVPGRFAVIRHAVTIPRILRFRFGLWITTTMITSEVVHSLTGSFA